jgi:hypothetical protein
MIDDLELHINCKYLSLGARIADDGLKSWKTCRLVKRK